MPEDLVITHLFDQVAERLPQKVCLQIEREGVWVRYAYSEVEELARRTAAFLIDGGVKKGDPVLLIMENCPEWAISYLGIVYSGGCAVPVDPKATSREIENITADCRPKAALTSQRAFRENDFINPDFNFSKIIVVDLFEEPLIEENIVNFAYIKQYKISEGTHFPELSPDDNASLIYTSGTTGRPKGVLLSHRNFSTNVKSFEELKIFSEEDTFLSILPLFHSYAFMASFLVPVSSGATISYCLSFKPEDVTRVIRESRTSVVPAVPQFFSLLRDKIFSKYDSSPPALRPFIFLLTRRRVRKTFGKTLRLFVSGGARLDPQIAKDITNAGIKLVEGYGLTETSPVVSLNPIESPKFGSVGRPIPDVEVRIDSPNESGIGEVLIKGHNVMKGYFKRPELTKEVIKNGWFYSGDLGYLDEEDYLFITGRLKEVIVLSSGKNIYPEELEAVYGASPYIKELCILSKGEKERLHAVVVPELTYFRQMGVINIQDRIRWELENISKGLLPHNHIMGYTIVNEDLPRTRLGKLKRFELQTKYGKAEELQKSKDALEAAKKEIIYSAGDLNLIQAEASKKILSFLVKRLNRDVILDDNLEIDLGIDSLGRIELIDGLESLLDIKIPNEFMAKVYTVRELLSEIDMLKKRGAPKKAEKKLFDWHDVLDRLPPEEILKKICLKPLIRGKLFTWVLTKFLFCLFKSLWHLKVEGRDRLPKKGPYILCPNHASFLDGFIVAASLPYRIELNTFFLGYAAYFEHPLAAWAIRVERLIPLDPTTRLIEVMQASSYVLRNGKIMCIFPEGRRSADENPQDFKKGVAILAKEMDIPLIPVYIQGSHLAWPRTSRFPRLHPLKIIYGYPCSAGELIEKSDKGADEYEKVANALRGEVLRLKGRLLL